jgi:hypothetical protein
MRVPTVLRSWRFRIVAFVAILLSVIGGTWLWYIYHPLTPTEKQLVGGWIVTRGLRSEGQKFPSHSILGSYWRFHPDRTLSAGFGVPPASSVTLTWRVEGDSLVVRDSPPRTLRGLIDWVMSGLPRSDSTQYKILTLDHEEGRLVHLASTPDGNAHVTLIRIDPTAASNDPAP